MKDRVWKMKTFVISRTVVAENAILAWKKFAESVEEKYIDLFDIIEK